MPHICFVNSDNYPVLNPAYSSHYIGGESVQQTILAREFARQGWKVSMVCEDFGQPDGEVIDDIQVWKTYSGSEGLPVIRFIYPRFVRIWQALRAADADYYYQSCAGAMTGFVALFAKLHHKKMIFRLAHDTDCMPGKQLINYARDRKIYEFGLRNADVISAQSQVQSELLLNNYGLTSVITNMSVELPSADFSAERDIDVLWVNNLRDFKRPDLLCEIAADMPEVSFTMIGGAVAGQESLHRQVLEAAGGIPNLTYLGAVPYNDVNGYFLRAKIFLNTSDSEGFPNSFLQAWVRQVPVISFFDPDSLISTHGLGMSPESKREACAAISSLMSDSKRRIEMGQTARSFVLQRYAPAAVVDNYVSQFDHGISI